MKGKVLLALVSLFLIIAWSVSSAEISASSLKKASKGQQLYADNCVGCHGDRGLGTASAPSICNVKQNAFMKAVMDGKGSMPSFKTDLSKSDTKKIVSYIKAINKAKKMISEKANYSATLDTIYDSSCASCHPESFREQGKAILDAKVQKFLSK